MKSASAAQSLKKRFRALSVRWSLIGLALTVAVVVPTVLAVVRHSSEREVAVMASALTRAFRPMILQDQIRDAKLQMEEVTKLKSDELVDVITPDFQSVYKETLDTKAVPHCTKPDVPCWIGGTKVSILKPVYFDDDLKKDLYGYLVLNLNPTIDWLSVFLIVLGSGIVFIFQVRGIYSALKLEGAQIEAVLASWKKRVDDPTKFTADEEEKTFAEFLPLSRSISALHSKISTLEAAAANAAATKAKIDIVRGIGHDLKTPLSNLSKFFYLFVENTKSTRAVNDLEVERIVGTMKRMGALIRNITNLGRKVESPTCTSLTSWLEKYTAELRTVLRIDNSSTKIEFSPGDAQSAYTMIHETDLLRLIGNLVQNALDALPTDNDSVGRISFSLDYAVDGHQLTIRDNGVGIPMELRERIFDLDFTTKKTQGTGLGLQNVRQICAELGLKLELKSEVGVGTAFLIFFPSPSRLQVEDFIQGEMVI